MTDNLATLIDPEVTRIRNGLCSAQSTRPAMDIRQLIQGWLTADGFSVLYGPSNAGKTFVGLSIAACVATGAQWWDCRVTQGPVLYMALEGGKAFQNRVAALVKQYPKLQESDTFQYLPLTIDLHSPRGYQTLCLAIPDRPWALIVVDTLARSMAGADENAAKDMGQMIDNLTALRDATGAHIMAVHHSGKDANAGARGSSPLRAAADTEINVNELGEIKATKQRDLPAAAPLNFALESVSFGNNAEGEEVTSAVAVPATGPTQRSRKPLTGKNEVAMQALSDALRDHGEARVGGEYPHNRQVVHIDRWRETCDVHGLTSGTSDSAARTAFMRAKGKLMELDEVREWGNHVWRVFEVD